MLSTDEKEGVGARQDQLNVPSHSSLTHQIINKSNGIKSEGGVPTKGNSQPSFQRASKPMAQANDYFTESTHNSRRKFQGFKPNFQQNINSPLQRMPVDRAKKLRIIENDSSPDQVDHGHPKNSSFSSTANSPAQMLKFFKDSMNYQTQGSSQKRENNANSP